MDTILLMPDAVVLPSTVAVGACVAVAGGTIVSIHGERPATPWPTTRVEGVLLPGLIDLQVNGAGGHGVDECTVEALHQVARACATGGAAAFLPTLITAPLSQMCAKARWLAGWIRSARHAHSLPLGIHLEGPFLMESGAHDPSLFLEPTKDNVDALLEAAGGCLRLVTLAHGQPGAPEAVARLTAAGVSVALGHCAVERGFVDCVEAGATLVTHLYNAMGPMHHRRPGVSGLALDEPRLRCSLIVDGHHVHPAIVRQAWRLLGPERFVLMTDATAAAGMPDGHYRLSGVPVTASHGVVRDRTGHLAGSAVTMANAVSCLKEQVPGIGPWTIAQIGARNPASLLGATGSSLGTIAPGQRARFTVLARDGNMEVLAFDAPAGGSGGHHIGDLSQTS